MKPRIGITCARGDAAPDRYTLHSGYVEAIAAHGGLAVLLPCLPEADPAEYLDAVDGLLLSGGGDLDPAHFGEEPRVWNGRIDPVADVFELELARRFLAAGRPVLGICRGMQVLNVAAGGDLYQDLREDAGTTLQHDQQAPPWYGTHAVDVAEGSGLRAILQEGRVRVNSFHHQAVRRVAPGFLPAARAADGVIEAIERPGGAFTIGVQWHPERMHPACRASRRLFDAFVRAYSGRDAASA